MSIPGLPGVPPLSTTLKRSLISTAPVALFDALIPVVNQIWGVFDAQGNRVLKPDSFLGVRYRNGSHVSDYPVSPNSFSTYNKVQTPFEAVVSMACGGAQSQRSKFLQTVEKIANDINPYSIITPDETFKNATIERFDYERRRDNGANVVIVHLYFQQIRETASIQYTQTKSGAAIQSAVPKAQVTQSTTSTGIASATNTTLPASQGTVNQGAISTTTTTASPGVVQ